MVAHRFVAVVGARVLPETAAGQVAAVVRHFVERGWGIGTGGAQGADTFALEAVLATGRVACARSVVFLPGAVGGAGAAALMRFVALGGRVVTGTGAGRAALLGRSRRLAQASSGVVAFLWGPSRGSVFTVREAVSTGKPAAVVLVGGGAVLPAFAGGAWVACSVGSVAAFRWAPAGPQPDRDGEPEQKATALGRIFLVPDGEPMASLLAHISSLSQSERLWFEQGVVAGDTVLVPHEALSDTPAHLAVPRLMRRCRCTAREAAGLAELFLALDAGRDVVAHYEGEARRHGAVAVIASLVHLVACLALCAECPETEALEHAERLGDGAELLSNEGTYAQLPVQSDAGAAALAWHALGAVRSETVACRVCGARYDVDDEAVDVPACPECDTPDTWEARQGLTFQRLVAEIDGCPSLADLAQLGKRLYARPLPHDQAGVAWSHYQLRRAALEGAVRLGARARVLVGQVEQASPRALPRLGARL